MFDHPSREPAAPADAPCRGFPRQSLCHATTRFPERAPRIRDDSRRAPARETFRSAERYFASELSTFVPVRITFAGAQSPLSGSGVGFGAGVGLAAVRNLLRVPGSSTQAEYLTPVAVARSNSATAAL